MVEQRSFCSHFSDFCACVLSCVQLFATPWTVCSLPGSSVHGIFFQARILEWVAISSSRDLPDPGRDQTHVSCVSHIGKWILYHEAPEKPSDFQVQYFIKFSVFVETLKRVCGRNDVPSMFWSPVMPGMFYKFLIYHIIRVFLFMTINNNTLPIIEHMLTLAK